MKKWSYGNGGRALSVEDDGAITIEAVGSVSESDALRFIPTAPQRREIAAALLAGLEPEAPSETRTLEERREAFVSTARTNGDAITFGDARAIWAGLVAAGVVRQ